MLTEKTAPTTTEHGTTETLPPTLPGRDYYDPAVFEVERERIFFRSWLCVGREEEVANPGDVIVRDVVNEGILVTRDLDGELHAFYNSCRHRGARLLEEDTHVRKAISCPYHAWTYALDGALIGTPNIRKDEGLDRSRHPLGAIRIETWEGFLFVNLDDDAASLASTIAEDSEDPGQFSRYKLGELRIGRQKTWETKANWKIIIDNYNECLHCPTVHPELVTLIPSYRKGTTIEDPESWGVSLQEGATSLTRTGTSCLPPFPGLSDQDRHAYYGCLFFPTLFLDISSDAVVASTMWPTGPETSINTTYYLFRPETIADPAFDPSEIIEFDEIVGGQDDEVCEIAQRGVRSRGFAQGGVLPALDRFIVEFNQRYLAMRGPVD